mgnify:CR=1 FL=1|jgi:hypothetical protein|tara:strand:+ start:1997 stop:2686 length:690 start_codon:yes stop_codon:yes gene_type:complete
MRLITEVVEDCSVATEINEETGTKSYFVEGIFMQGDIKNRNGRIYPSQILESEMTRYNKDFISTKRALGELGHPEGPTINGDRVSHLITEMKRDGSNFTGKAKILGTPMGQIVKTFMDEGVTIGVSTRGLGSVKPTKEGIMEVQNDFHLATVDIVTDPSGPNCFVNGIMENAEYYFDIASGHWIAQESIQQVIEEIQETVEQEVRRVVRRVDESTAAKLFERFISSLKN